MLRDHTIIGAILGLIFMVFCQSVSKSSFHFFSHSLHLFQCCAPVSQTNAHLLVTTTLVPGRTYPKRGGYRMLTHIHDQKKPLTFDLLAKLYTLCNLLGIQAKALKVVFLFAFFSFLCQSNLAPPTAKSFDKKGTHARLMFQSTLEV